MIPIKAIVLNLLSVGAAYGVLVWIFQYGHLQSLLGFKSTARSSRGCRCSCSWSCSASRWTTTCSSCPGSARRSTAAATEEAVAHGIKSTAGVVTSAAVVMVSVFAIFATLSLVIFKQLGIGLAVAVLLDATLVRGVLLPATMKLLGDWNWYLPKRLDWLPRVTAETPAPTPARPPQPEPADATRAGRHLALRNTSWRRGARRASLLQADAFRHTRPTRQEELHVLLHSSISQGCRPAPAVALRDVRKVYGRGEGTVVALDGVTVDLPAGSFTAIMGPSGSGKSTFLHVAAGLDRPTRAPSRSATRPDRLSERRLTILRRKRVGFVFQAFNLMPSLTVAQNIGLPLRLDGRRRDARRCVTSRPGRAGETPSPPSVAALGRPTAARRDRPGARHPARGRVRRRADRSAGHAHRARRARPAARACRPRRPHGRDGHPRSRGRGARRPRHPARRRADRRDARGSDRRRRRRAARAPGGLNDAASRLLTARGRLGTFTGALIALAASAVLAMACGMLLESALRTHPPVERYAAAAAVVTGQQNVGTDHDVPLGERARVSAALAARLAAVPASGPRSPTSRCPPGSPAGPPYAHGWRSAALTPYVLTAGRAPAGPGEVVTGYRATLGARLASPPRSAARTVTVVGIARPRTRSRNSGDLPHRRRGGAAGRPSRDGSTRSACSPAPASTPRACGPPPATRRC